jgi:hypothetical protein
MGSCTVQGIFHYSIRGWNAAPISVPRICGLGNLFFNLKQNSTIESLFKHDFTQI